MWSIDANGHKFQAVLNQLLLEKPQEKEISRPKTNDSWITHTPGDKSRVTCIQVFTNHVYFSVTFTSHVQILALITRHA